MIRSSRARVLLVSPYDIATPGGVTEHVSQLAHALRARGYASSILAPHTPHLSFRTDPEVWAAGRAVAVPGNGSIARISLSLQLAAGVKRTLRTIEPDLIHLHEPFVPLLPLAVLRHSRAATVATFHAYSHNGVGYRFGAPLLRSFSAQLAGRIAVSDTARSFVARYFPGNYTVIPNGVDLDRFAKAPPFPDLRDGPPVILFVGRLDERKGFPVLLRAYEELRHRGVVARLLVVGAYTPCQRSRFARLVERRRIPDVVFAGWATPDALARYYRSSRVVCAPSLGNESFGIVLLEAMAAGRPVVASAIDGYREVVTDLQDGLLVAPGSASELTEALQRVLQDADLARALGQVGAESAGAYAWPVVADRIIRAYEAAGGGREPSAAGVISADPTPRGSGSGRVGE